MAELSTGSLNLAWGDYLLRSLEQMGVRDYIVSPGSRSTPLTLPTALNSRLKNVIRLDERSSAFYALGLAKASGKPVGLICTSGTAMANYMPAIIEASQNEIPLILLTADRPPELRNCRPGQTINQLKMFGNYVRYFKDLPPPSKSKSSQLELNRVFREIKKLLNSETVGPVHLNCPFREPLFSADQQWEKWEVELCEDEISESKPLPDFDQLPANTLILAGPVARKWTEATLQGLARLSNGKAWPILADASFPARHFNDDFEYLISNYEIIFRNKDYKENMPDGILMIGEIPTCKTMRQALSDFEGEVFQLNEVAAQVDPVQLNPKRLDSINCLSKVKAFDKLGLSSFAAAWLSLDKKAGKGVASFFAEAHHLFEGDVCQLLNEQLPESAPIIVANSLSIRAIEWFWPSNNKKFQFQTMRGANGIDGTLSYARGSVSGFKQSGVLLTGDLAFLHDSNGLLQAAEQTPGLLVVLINNQGGGVFNLLPISKWNPPFESLFATPQSVEFKSLCQAHGIPHQVISKKEDLSLFDFTPPESGIHVLEIVIDRNESATLHQSFFNLQF